MGSEAGSAWAGQSGESRRVHDAGAGDAGVAVDGVEQQAELSGDCHRMIRSKALPGHHACARVARMGTDC